MQEDDSPKRSTRRRGRTAERIAWAGTIDFLQLFVIGVTLLAQEVQCTQKMMINFIMVLKLITQLTI